MDNEHLEVDPYGEENWNDVFEELKTSISGDPPPMLGISGGSCMTGINGCSGHSGVSGVIDPEQEKFRRKAVILRKNYQPKQKYSNKIFKNNTRQK